MGRTKFRNFQSFRGPVTFVGSTGLQGVTLFTGALTVGSGPPTFKGNSSTVQFFGRSTINSGATTVVISTTVVKSDDWINVSPILGGTTQTSGGVLCVQTITEGTFFTIGYVNGGYYGGGPMYACWEIRRVGS